MSRAGLYRLPGYADTLESEFICWSLWAGSGTETHQVVVGHKSALHYYGLSDMRPQDVHLIVPPRQFYKKEKTGCQFHRTELAGHEYDRKQGFLITTPYRTLIDMKPELMLGRQWIDIVNIAQTKRLIDERQSVTLLSEIPGYAVAATYPIEEPAMPVSPQSAEVTTAQRSPIAARRSLFASSRQGLLGSRSAFTLVELLVVIAIIGILASFLMPVLSKAQQTARSAACNNNQRQMMLTLQSYWNDNRDINGGPHWNTTTASARWHRIVTYYLEIDKRDLIIGADPIMPGGNQFSVLHCPGDASTFSNGNPYMNYGMNGNYSANQTGQFGLDKRHITAIRHPSKVMAIGDGCSNQYGATGTSFRIAAIGVNPTTAYDYTRHPGPSANYAMVDGHVQALVEMSLISERMLGSNSAFFDPNQKY